MKYFNVFDLIAEEFKKAGVNYLLIGGFALNGYGVMRQTMDVDLMLAAESEAKVAEILKRFEFKAFDKQEVFIRYNSPRVEWMAIDLMLVDKETLEPMIREGKKLRISGYHFTIPSLNHLIALKLHSLKFNRKIREYKDLPDIFSLVTQNKMNVRSAGFKELCLKFGTQELYDKIVERVKGSS